MVERHPELGPVETCIDGVFICGTIQSPKDISDSLTQASSAAGKAAMLLGKQQVSLEPAVSEVNPEMCRACGLCAELCEFHAPELVSKDGKREVAEINPALCKGCGTCTVWCPTGAINSRHFSDQQIGAMISSLFEEYHA